MEGREKVFFPMYKGKWDQNKGRVYNTVKYQNVPHEWGHVGGQDVNIFSRYMKK